MLRRQAGPLHGPGRGQQGRPAVSVLRSPHPVLAAHGPAALTRYKVIVLDEVGPLLHRRARPLVLLTVAHWGQGGGWMPSRRPAGSLAGCRASWRSPSAPPCYPPPPEAQPAPAQAGRWGHPPTLPPDASDRCMSGRWSLTWRWPACESLCGTTGGWAGGVSMGGEGWARRQAGLGSQRVVCFEGVGWGGVGSLGWGDGAWRRRRGACEFANHI